MRRAIRLFSTLKFTKSHEWINFDPTKKTAKIGISNYAQQQLGQIIFLQLPRVGKTVSAGQSIAVAESVKIAADIYTPIPGKIVAINNEVGEKPYLINDDAMKSWIVEVTYNTEPSDLLTQEQYNKLVN